MAKKSPHSKPAKVNLTHTPIVHVSGAETGGQILVQYIRPHGEEPPPSWSPLPAESRDLLAPEKPTKPILYEIPAIRELLTEALTDGDLNRLCYDHFRMVYEKFSNQMGKDDKIQHLVEYCDRQERLAELLEFVRKLNSKKYRSFEGRLWR